MAYVGDAELVRVAVGLRKIAFEQTRDRIVQTMTAPFNEKLASAKPAYTLAAEHYALFLHVTRP